MTGEDRLGLTWLGGITLAVVAGALFAFSAEQGEPLLWIACVLGPVAGILLTVAMIGSGVKLGLQAARPPQN